MLIKTILNAKMKYLRYYSYSFWLYASKGMGFHSNGVLNCELRRSSNLQKQFP